MVLYAHYKTFACLKMFEKEENLIMTTLMICYLFREHSRNPVFVVVLDISYNLCLNSRPEPFGSFAVRGPWLEVSRFLVEVVILERLFRPGEPIYREQVEKT